MWSLSQCASKATYVTDFSIGIDREEVLGLATTTLLTSSFSSMEVITLNLVAKTNLHCCKSLESLFWVSLSGAKCWVMTSQLCDSQWEIGRQEKFPSLQVTQAASAGRGRRVPLFLVRGRIVLAQFLRRGGISLPKLRVVSCANNLPAHRSAEKFELTATENWPFKSILASHSAEPTIQLKRRLFIIIIILVMQRFRKVFLATYLIGFRKWTVWKLLCSTVPISHESEQDKGIQDYLSLLDGYLSTISHCLNEVKTQTLKWTIRQLY